MLFPGAQGSLAQARFALKPDGLFLGAMLGGQTLQVSPDSTHCLGEVSLQPQNSSEASSCHHHSAAAAAGCVFSVFGLLYLLLISRANLDQPCKPGIRGLNETEPTSAKRTNGVPAANPVTTLCCTAITVLVCWVFLYPPPPPPPAPCSHSCLWACGGLQEKEPSTAVQLFALVCVLHFMLASALVGTCWAVVMC